MILRGMPDSENTGKAINDNGFGTAPAAHRILSAALIPTTTSHLAK